MATLGLAHGCAALRIVRLRATRNLAYLAERSRMVDESGIAFMSR
jgi:hypothetical protein